MKKIMMAFAVVGLMAPMAMAKKSEGKKRAPANSQELRLPFSAFTYRGQLYVTYLGDCNTQAFDVKADSFCDKNRRTRNAVVQCNVEMVPGPMTAMGCPKGPPTPKIVEIDLAKTNVDLSAKSLKINFYGTIVETDLH